MNWTQILGVGDPVREREGRHIGRVVAVVWSRDVKVRWDDTGWIEWLDIDDVERDDETWRAERIARAVIRRKGEP